MSRRNRGERGGRSGATTRGRAQNASRPDSKPTPPRRTPKSGIVPALGVVAALGLVALGGMWLARRHPPPPVAAPNPVDALAPEAAFQIGIQLQNQNRGAEAILYYRRALRAGAAAPWQAHYNYATVLFNTLFERDTIAGMNVPRVRYSDERVAVMREVLNEYLSADRVASEPEKRALIRRRLGNVLHVWGFEWEAFYWSRLAQEDDPAHAQYRLDADALASVLANPISTIALADSTLAPAAR